MTSRDRVKNLKFQRMMSLGNVSKTLCGIFHSNDKKNGMGEIFIILLQSTQLFLP